MDSPSIPWLFDPRLRGEDGFPHLPRRPADGQLHGLCGAPRQRAHPGPARAEPHRLAALPARLQKDWSPFLGGLGQPVADAMKFLLKEDFVPAHVNKFYFWIAPCLAMMPALVTLAAIPFGSEFLGAEDGGGRYQCGHALHVRDLQHRRLRHRARGVVVELEILRSSAASAALRR